MLSSFIYLMRFGQAKWFVLGLMLFMSVPRSRAQVTQKLDSLSQKAQYYSRPDQQVDFWLTAFQSYRYEYPEIAEQCIASCFALLPRMRQQLSKGYCHYWRAWLALGDPNSQNILLAKTDLKIAYTIFQQMHTPLWLARTNHLFAFMAIYENDLARAQTYVQTAKKLIPGIHGQSRDSSGISAKLHATQASILMQENTDNVHLAKKELKKAWQIYLQLNDSRELAETQARLIQLSSPAEAELLYAEAQTLLKATRQYAALGKLSLSFGKYYQQQYFFPNVQWLNLSTQYFQQALANPAIPHAEICFQIAYNYHQLAAAQAVGASANRLIYADSAQTFYLSALQHAQKEHNSDILKTATNNLAAVCHLLGNCPAVMQKVGQSYQGLLDSGQRIAALAQQREAHFKQDLLQQQAKQRLLIIILIAGLVLSLVVGVALFLHQRQKMKIQTQQIESMENKLSALRAQMSPHFLSNNLNILESLVNHQRTAEASRHIIQFSRFCRKILDYSRKKFISLEEEIQLQRHFLELEASGSAGELQFEIQVDPALNLNTWGIPPMLLNPFVENAIKHGYKKKQAPTLISLKLQATLAETLRCTIEDDGLGREKVQAMQAQMLFHEHSSYGIAIAEEQIEKIPGAALRIEDVLQNEEVCGTRVMITLPKIPLS